MVQQALDLADDHGLGEVALGRVADELGVQPSALYNHIDGLDGLRHDLAVRSAENLAGRLRDAAVARAGADALRSVATAYRRFATDHPGQYASTLLPPASTDERLAGARRSIIDLFVQVLAPLGLGDDEALHRARAVMSGIHGFLALEAIDAFTQPLGTDESFERLIELFIASVEND